MIEFTAIGSDILLPVQGQPGARRNSVVGAHAGRLKVAVTQVAEKGKATQAIRELLAESLGIATSRVTVESGESQPKKLFRLSDIDAERVREWLSTLGIDG